MKITLTRIAGIQVGHAQDLDAITGCSVVLCPPDTRCAVDQRGGAPGTRETDLLRPGRLVQNINAIMLAGGSAFGLAAADGAMAFLEEKGLGYETAFAPIPIVPAAILYDLEIGSSEIRPDAEMGAEACKNASGAPVQSGCVGAGTGCRVGGFGGLPRSTKSGLGNAGMFLPGGVVISAMMAVNALGDVLDEHGKVIAGLRKSDNSHEFADSEKELLAEAGELPRRRANTVIGVVATNAKLSRDELTHIAAMAHDGLARAIRPSHTMFDGDTIFALSAGELPCNPLQIGVAAAQVTRAAIVDAVCSATSLGNVPAICDFK